MSYISYICLFTFSSDGYSYFLPFYEENLQPHVEEDVLQLKVDKKY